MNFEEAGAPTREQALATLRSGREDPVTMVNLLRFKTAATYESGETLSGREAYGRYYKGFEPLLLARGGRILSASTVDRLMIGSVSDPWDAVIIVEYPNADAFAQIVNSPEYKAIYPHRIAGLAGQLNIETTRWAAMAAP